MSKIDADPQWFFKITQNLAFLLTPFNIFTLFLIIYCNFEQTRKIKNYLICFQFFAILTDLHNVFGFLPVFYSSADILMFSSNGLLTKIVNYEPHFDFSISQVFMILKCGSIEQLFFMIYQGILPPNHPQKRKKSTCFFRFLISNSIWIIFSTSYYYSILPNQSEILPEILKIHPEIFANSSMLQQQQNLAAPKKRITILTAKNSIFTHIFYAIIISRSIFGICQSLYFVMKCKEVFIYYPILSQRTRKIKKKFVKNVCLQIGLPILIFYTPLIVAMVATQFEIFEGGSQTINLICLIIISTHTFFGSLALFLLPGSYQNWILSLFGNSNNNTSSSI